MKCPACGFELNGNAKFCSECGAKVLLEKQCPDCGSKVGLTSKFCTECGYRFPADGVPATPRNTTGSVGDNKVVAEDVLGEVFPDGMQGAAQSAAVSIGSKNVIAGNVTGATLSSDAMPDSGYSAPALSMGDKNVIAGDVIGRKEDYHIQNTISATIIEDKTKKLVQCHICNRNITISNSVECPQCHKITCENCYDRNVRLCSNCKENEYRSLLQRVADNGIITLAKRNMLDEFSKTLNLRPEKAHEIEQELRKHLTEKSATEGNADPKHGLIQQSLEKAELLLFDRGNPAAAFELLKPLHADDPHREDILVDYIIAAQEAAPEEARGMLQKTNADILGLELIRIDQALARKDELAAMKTMDKADKMWHGAVLLDCRRIMVWKAMYDRTGDSQWLDKANGLLFSINEPTTKMERSWNEKVKKLMGYGSESNLAYCQEQDLFYFVLNSGSDGFYQLALASEQDEAEYARLILRAAKCPSPSADALKRAAVCLYEGKGTNQNVQEAVQLYQKAAEKGDVDSQSLLGQWYLFGKNVSKSAEKSVQWLEKAAEQGNEVAKDLLQKAMMEKLGMEIDGTVFKKYRYSEQVKEFVIPSGITEIAASAFSRSGILSIEIPSTVKVIHKNAFFMCEDLQSVLLHAGLETIGECAFQHCKSLSEIIIPGTVKEIGNLAFHFCKSLRKAVLNDGIEIIGNNAFDTCESLSEITIPGTVKEIGKDAFKDCNNLRKAVLNDGIEIIGNNAFDHCESLSEITIPGTVKEIGVLFSFCKNIKKVFLNDGIEKIMDRAFQDCKFLSEITIPGSVKTIGSYAFYGCNGLNALSLMNGIEIIEDNAFCFCSSLLEVIIPKTVIKIDGDAFGWCKNLKKVIFDGCPDFIDDCTFVSCGMLSECITPDRLANYIRDIDNYDTVFEGCPIRGVSDDKIRMWHEAVEQRKPEAQYQLAKCYLEGIDVHQSDSNAVRWFRNAAKQGYAPAQKKLGDCYHDGIGVVKDSKEAAEWYSKAKEQGFSKERDSGQLDRSVPSVHNNGKDTPNSGANEKKLDLQLDEQENVDSLYQRGILFYTGIDIKGDNEKAVRFIREAAEKGYADAQYWLGKSYSYGLCTEEDDSESFKWLHLAAEQGHAKAQFDLALYYRDGTGTDIDDAEARKWFCLAAKQGNKKAQSIIEKLEEFRGLLDASEQGALDAEGMQKLNLFYDSGEVTKQDQAESFKWLRMAAEHGNADAQFSFGKCYKFGAFVDCDETEAEKWFDKAEKGFLNAVERGDTEAAFKLANFYMFRDNEQNTIRYYEKAVEQGHTKAMIGLCNCYLSGYGVEMDRDKSVNLIRKAAELGDAEAQGILGRVYLKGLPGSSVEADLAEFVKWCRKGAEGGDPDAQWNLAGCYENGLEVEKNLSEAAKWYLMAAEQGSAEAQYRVGMCYYTGQGVDRDILSAMLWFTYASDQGHIDAQTQLAYCFESGQGANQDDEKAVKLYLAAAEQGGAVAQRQLALFYYHGDHVDQNFEEALKWWNMAVEQGFADAQADLGYIYANGECGVKQDMKKARKMYKLAAEQGSEIAKEWLKEN